MDRPPSCSATTISEPLVHAHLEHAALLIGEHKVELVKAEQRTRFAEDAIAQFVETPRAA